MSDHPNELPPGLVHLEHPRVSVQPPKPFSRPVVRGKFFYIGTQKFYLKGVTYGPFAPTTSGCEYHDVPTVERDFVAIAAAGMNAVRTYTVPPRWLLDIAQKHGLRVMVGLPWEQHVAFLDDAGRAKAILQRVRAMVKTCSGHPAVLAFAVGNEIPAPIVRWHGAQRIEVFLERLTRIVRAEDPHALITYVNYPTTEYLQLPFLDFVCFNVYLESAARLTPYLSKLQTHTQDRPLVLGEIGLDSQRNGLAKQAEALDWQIRAAFAAGGAGMFTFAWTDEWYRGGAEITDWAFGLTDRQRQPKPALAMVAQAYAEAPFGRDRPWPRISVVVCTYNGSRTIRDTCAGLLQLKYPNFEVIVIDDGSKDGVGDIAREYGFTVVRTPNGGLSRARNLGAEHATGEIIAYIDDDAYPGQNWLYYLAHTFMTSNHVAVGGPNLPPPGDGLIADCVANSPGGPIHVLVTDEIAEHIPGCNFAVRKSALLAVGGFDATFRIAGDDVDLCWRLQDHGWTIGFSPAAVVWHHRRNSMRAYLRQQTNYGRAEAMLERKWPGKYNAAGHIPWVGKLYGRGALQTFRVSRGRIYQGVWGSAPFQSLYQPAPGLISMLPAMPDWYLIIAALGLLALMSTFWPPLFWAWPVLFVAAGAPLVQALLGAANAQFVNQEPVMSRWITKYALVFLLHLLQPIVRFYGRIDRGLHPLRRRGARRLVIPKRRRLVVWQENWVSAEQILTNVEDVLEKNGAAVRRGGEWDHWDLRVSGGLLGGARLRMATEEHGQGKQQLLFRLWPTWSAVGVLVIVLLAAMATAAGVAGYHAAQGKLTFEWSYIPCAVLSLASLFLALKALREAGFAQGAMVEAMKPQTQKE